MIQSTSNGKLRIYAISCISILLHIYYSFFMSDFFVQFPSIGKEIFLLLPFMLTSIAIYQEKVIRMNYYTFSYISLLGLYTIIGFLNNAPDIMAIRFYIIPIVILYFLNICKVESVQIIKQGLISFLVILSIVGYWEIYKLGGITRFISILSPNSLMHDLKINRTYLVFTSPAISGMVMGSLCLYVTVCKVRYRKILLCLSLPIFIYCFSRTALIAYIVATLFYFYRTGNKFSKWMLIFIGNLIIVLAIRAIIRFIFNDEAFIERLAIYERVLSNFNLLGNGIGFVSSSGTFGVNIIFDNDFLRHVYEIGIFGLGLYILSLIRVTKGSFLAQSMLVYMVILMSASDFHLIYPAPVICYLAIGIFVKETKENVMYQTN